MKFTFAKEGQFEIFTAHSPTFADFLDLADHVESRLDRAIQDDRVALIIIDTGLVVGTYSELLKMANDYEQLAELEWRLPGYRLAFVYGGDPNSLGHDSEQRWERGGVLQKLAAIAEAAIYGVDALGGLAALAETKLFQDGNVRFFNSEDDAKEWLLSR